MRSEENNYVKTDEKISERTEMWNQKIVQFSVIARKMQILVSRNPFFLVHMKKDLRDLIVSEILYLVKLKVRHVDANTRLQTSLQLANTSILIQVKFTKNLKTFDKLRNHPFTGQAKDFQKEGSNFRSKQQEYRQEYKNLKSEGQRNIANNTAGDNFQHFYDPTNVQKPVLLDGDQQQAIYNTHRHNSDDQLRQDDHVYDEDFEDVSGDTDEVKEPEYYYYYYYEDAGIDISHEWNNVEPLPTPMWQKGSNSSLEMFANSTSM